MSDTRDQIQKAATDLVMFYVGYPSLDEHARMCAMMRKHIDLSENTKLRSALEKIQTNDPESNRLHADEIANAALGMAGTTAPYERPPSLTAAAQRIAELKRENAKLSAAVEALRQHFLFKSSGEALVVLRILSKAGL